MSVVHIVDVHSSKHILHIWLTKYSNKGQSTFESMYRRTDQPLMQLEIRVIYPRNLPGGFWRHDNHLNLYFYPGRYSNGELNGWE